VVAPEAAHHQWQEEQAAEVEVAGPPEDELLQQQARTPEDREREAEAASAAPQPHGTVSIAAERSVRPQPVNAEASAFSQYGQLEVRVGAGVLVV
jgi:hypothetical protein